MQDKKHLILYDGVCGLCNRLVRFVLPRDRLDRFRFAALQGGTARRVLRNFGRDPVDLDTFYVIADFEGAAPRLYERDRASIFVLGSLGFPWILARAFRLLPGFLRRWGYNFIARHRYQWFGKYDTCLLPAPEIRHRFLP
jgi:predicted DCC family thiol-disulfide oxidoreductase YuxK